VRVKNLRDTLGMKGCFQAKGEGKGGGIALYWLEEVTIELLSFRNHHIDVDISGGLMITCGMVPMCMGNQK
jgi:hypothetical protein